MKVLVLPRYGNPYQGLLYDEVVRDGTRVRYAGEWTGRPRLDLALLPVELGLYRLRGWRILHIHWVATFALPGSRRFPFVRRLAQSWFSLCLAVATLLGIRVVWTAHNVLPHEPVFADDVAARRTLVRRAHTVIVHSDATLDDLDAIGARPRRTACIPMGVFVAPARSPDHPQAVRRAGPFRFLFFGFVREYKGTEELLEAAALLPPGSDMTIDIIGPCGDSALEARLRALAVRAVVPVAMRFEHVPDDELLSTVEDADAVVLPFRKVTTSSSALLAMTLGKPVVLPALHALRDLPASAVVRYDGSTAALASTLASVAALDPDRLAEMGRAGTVFATGHSWDAAATTTRGIYRRALGER